MANLHGHQYGTGASPLPQQHPAHPPTCWHADEGTKDEDERAHEAAGGWDEARVLLMNNEAARRCCVPEPAALEGCVGWGRGKHVHMMQCGTITQLGLAEACCSRGNCKGCSACWNCRPCDATACPCHLFRPTAAHQSDRTAARALVEALMPAAMKTVDAAITLRSLLTRKMLRSRKPRNLPAGAPHGWGGQMSAGGAVAAQATRCIGHVHMESSATADQGSWVHGGAVGLS